jgi:hypothetical protein
VETALFFGVIAGMFALVAALDSKRRIRRKLKRAARVPIGQLAEGAPARIVGKVRLLDGKVLEGPLSERRCVAYVGVVDQQGSPRNSIWRELARHQEGVSFLVEDASGRVAVDFDGAEAALDLDKEDVTSPGLCPPRVRAFVARHGRGERIRADSGPVRYREGVLAVDELVAVLGVGVAEPDPEALPDDAYRGMPKTRMRMASSKRAPVLISDASETKQ